MTDLERVREMFNYLGVSFEPHYKSNGDTLLYLTDNGGTVRAYPCFYSFYAFDKDGKFEQIGIYE